MPNLTANTVRSRPEAQRTQSLRNVFQEYSLDSTGLDCSMTLFMILIVPLYYLLLWNQVDTLQ